MFDKMDDLISQGKGDEEYKQLFQDMYVGISVQSSNLSGRIFVFGRTFDLVSGQQCICACAMPHPLCN